MADQDQRSGIADACEPFVAFRAERDVPHGEHFVKQQHVRLQSRCDREPEPDLHPRTVALHRCIDELADAGEIDDGVEFSRHFAPRQPQHGTVDEDILPSGQQRIESGPERDECSDAATQFDPAFIRLDQSVEHLEQRRLAGAVTAHQSDTLSAAHLQPDVVDRPEFVGTQDSRR